jgi:hypothetical protein
VGEKTLRIFHEANDSSEFVIRSGKNSVNVTESKAQSQLELSETFRWQGVCQHARISRVNIALSHAVAVDADKLIEIYENNSSSRFHLIFFVDSPSFVQCREG